MRPAWLAAIALGVIAQGGCSTSPFVSYRNGPVTLYIGDVRHVCAAGGSDNRGCTVRYPNGRVEVYCADADYECLAQDRKSTRLKSSHLDISYGVMLLDDNIRVDI